MKKIGIILIVVFLQFSSKNVQACTVFYIAKDSKVFAGSNEDWEDPNSMIWFYPSAKNSHGWIKFGWGSGFPQGGVNDQGLFWDATGCSFLEMPESEANKVHLSTPVMLEIIEKCSNLKEAKQIFQQYYCEDQYKAQYLVGDSTGNSIIVEGDNIIEKQKDYQVLTNFYQSHPELGGYPCWRYETAVGMLENASEINSYFSGTVLAATHQEGRYPTQYSVIYNLKDLKIYIFHFNNYQEFLMLDVLPELEKGMRSYSLPALFSSIDLIYPTDNQYVKGNELTFTWKAKEEHSYQIIYSTSPDFIDFEIQDVVTMRQYKPQNSSFLFITGLIPFFTYMLFKKRKLTDSLFLVVLIFLLPACSKDESSPEIPKIIDISATINDLKAGTRYYWKVQAHNPDHSEFFTETLTKSFQTLP